MSNGINKHRLERCKKISIKGYLIDKHPDMFRFGKNKLTLIKKDNSDYVVYDDHAFVFTDNVSHPRRDNIDVMQDLFGYGFIEAVEELERWAFAKHVICDDNVPGPSPTKPVNDARSDAYIDEPFSVPEAMINRIRD